MKFIYLKTDIICLIDEVENLPLTNLQAINDMEETKFVDVHDVLQNDSDYN